MAIPGHKQLMSSRLALSDKVLVCMALAEPEYDGPVLKSLLTLAAA